MSEEQAFITFPSLLDVFYLHQYKSGRGVATRKGGEISSCSDIVQYLTRSYARPNYITDVILQFRATRQIKCEI